MAFIRLFKAAPIHSAIWAKIRRFGTLMEPTDNINVRKSRHITTGKSAIWSGKKNGNRTKEIAKVRIANRGNRKPFLGWISRIPELLRLSNHCQTARGWPAEPITHRQTSVLNRTRSLSWYNFPFFFTRLVIVPLWPTRICTYGNLWRQILRFTGPPFSSLGSFDYW